MVEERSSTPQGLNNRGLDWVIFRDRVEQINQLDRSRALAALKSLIRDGEEETTRYKIGKRDLELLHQDNPAMHILGNDSVRRGLDLLVEDGAIYRTRSESLEDGNDIFVYGINYEYFEYSPD